MLVQGLRDAGMTVYKAAQSKNQDNIVMAADNDNRMRARATTNIARSRISPIAACELNTF